MRLAPVHHLDRFAVFNAIFFWYSEGHVSMKSAQYAADVLNEHEKRNGRPQGYVAIPLSASMAKQLYTKNEY